MSLSAIACVQAADSREKDRPPVRSTDASELAGTLKMIAAHAPLRARETGDPNSPANLSALESMLKKSIARGGSPRRTVTLPRPASDLVGTLQGRFSVDNRGRGNYSLDLPLPDSRGYFQPQLSVDYASGTGDGVVGRSFYVGTGFYHSITRGRTLLARDGVARGKELGDRDIFYLDGKRLLRVGGAGYGLPGSVYRTEVDSFITVTAEGGGREIERFIVQNRSGRTFVFGKFGESEDAYQSGFDENRGVLAPRAHTFALKRVEDLFGDFVEFSYEHVGFGEWLLTAIRYTGGRNIAAPFEISYRYTTPPGADARYQTLQRVDDSHLLEAISVSETETRREVARYAFEYSGGPLRAHSRLRSVQAFLAPDVGAPLQSLPSTTFEWLEQPAATAQFTPFASTPGNSGDTGVVFQFGDFDADGKKDYVEARDGLHVFLSTTSGPGPNGEAWLPERSLRAAGPVELRQLLAADFNGDRRTDLLVVGAAKGMALASTGEAFVPFGTVDVSSRFPAVADAAGRFTAADYNGDARDDLIVHTPDGRLILFFSNGTSLVEQPAAEFHVGRAVTPDDARGAFGRGSIPRAATLQTFAEDLNGDGLIDYVWRETSRSVGTSATGDAYSVSHALKYVLLLPEGRFSEPVTLLEQVGGPWHSLAEMQPLDACFSVVAGDYNGDGLTDFLVWIGSERGWTTLLSRGHPTNVIREARDTFRQVADAIPASTGTPRIDQRWSVAGQALSRASWEETVAPTNSGRPADAFDVMTAWESSQLLQAFAVDCNSDGRDDFVWLEPATPNGAGAAPAGWRVAYANGHGRFAAPVPLSGAFWDSAGRRPPGHGRPWQRLSSPGDMTGDGRPDWVAIAGRNASVNRVVSFAPSNGVLDGHARPGAGVTDFTNGYGSTTHVEYRAAGDAAIYSPGAPVAYPILDWRSASLVVSDLWNDVGSETASQFSYQYSGNQIDFSARGGLGFTAFTTFDPQTGFIKYQFLEKSFPMTGLTEHEATYRHWRTGNEIALELIKSEDYVVTFDAVRHPGSGALYGTLYPFTSQITERAWAADHKPDYQFALEDLASAGRKSPVLSARLPSQPAGQTITRTAFDDQADAGFPAMVRPDVGTGYTSGAAPPFAPAGERAADFLTRARAFPAHLTFGNERIIETEAGSEPLSRVIKTYVPPQNDSDPVTSRVASSVAVKWLRGDWTRRGTTAEYNYFGRTGYYETEILDDRFVDPGIPRQTKTTRYRRDARGRVTRREVWIADYQHTPAKTSSSTPYQASGYSDALDRPTAETTEQWSRDRLDYNRLFRKLSTAHYSNGVTAAFTYDGLGRPLLTTNDAGYRAETIYAWTTPADRGWRQRQRVTGPPASGSGLRESVYAVRETESNEATATTYYDRRSQVLRVVTEASDGGMTWQDTGYDVNGEVVATSKPYEPLAEKVAWTIKSFDAYGRETGQSETEATGPLAQPENAAEFVLRARLHEVRDNVAGAIADFEKATALAPDAAEHWFALARLRRGEDDKEGALRDISKAIQIDPAAPEPLASRGYWRLQDRDLEGSDADLTKAIDLNPQSASNWSLRGDVRFIQKKYADAIHDYDRAVALDESDAHAWYRRGAARLRANDLDGAIADLDQAIRREPEHEMAHYRRAEARLAKGDVEGAIADYSVTIDVNPEDLANVQARGCARQIAGDFQGALADFEQCLADPTEPWSYARIWAYLLRRRLGLSPSSEPLDLVQATAKSQWVRHIAAFLKGEIDESALAAEANATQDDSLRDRQCEACYYAGIARLLNDDPVAARAQFERALTIDAPFLDEFLFARAELRRLNASAAK